MDFNKPRLRNPLIGMIAWNGTVKISKVGDSKIVSIPNSFRLEANLTHVTEVAGESLIRCMLVKGIKTYQEFEEKFVSKTDDVCMFAAPVKISGSWRVKGNEERFCYKVVLPRGAREKFEVGEEVFCVFTTSTSGKFFDLFDYNRMKKGG